MYGMYPLSFYKRNMHTYNKENPKIKNKER